MNIMLKTTLASAFAVMTIVGTAPAFAADNDGRDNSSTESFDRTRDPSPDDLRNQLDMNSTGSIERCASQMWDDRGTCVADPGYQDAQ